MKAWTVEVTPEAAEELEHLPTAVARDAIEIMEDLREDPFPGYAEPLAEYKNQYKIRFGQEAFRLLYRVSVRPRKILVWRIRPRATAYDGLRKPIN